MELTWFRPPGDGGPGLLNLCYTAVDVHVIRGRATAPAVRHAGGELDFAVLLERVAALAGALRSLGAQLGGAVVARLDDPLDDLLMFLACARLGAPYVPAPDGEALLALVEEHRPGIVATCADPDFPGHVPAACLVRGVAPQDPMRDLDWDIALRAGRTDPAACAELAPNATAYLVAERAVAVSEAPYDVGSRLGGICAALVNGEPVDLAGSVR